MSIFRRNNGDKPITHKALIKALRTCGVHRVEHLYEETVDYYEVYDPRNRFDRSSSGRPTSDNKKMITLVGRFEAAVQCLCTPESGAEQLQTFYTQVAALPAVWEQRQAASDAWDQARADAQLLHPTYPTESLDTLEGVAEPKARYERAAAATTSLFDSICERIRSAEEAIAAQRLAQNTADAVLRRAVAATEAQIGGPCSEDAASVALNQAAAGHVEVMWSQALVDEAKCLSDAAEQLGRHPMLASGTADDNVCDLGGLYVTQ